MVEHGVLDFDRRGACWLGRVHFLAVLVLPARLFQYETPTFFIRL